MVGPVTDVFASPALPILLGLERDGLDVGADGERLRIRPADRVTPERRAELVLHKPDLLMLLRCCDAGVGERRDVMRTLFEAAPAGRTSALLFRPGLPYVEGRCFSCGDPLQTFRVGRCWRCSLAWRLAVRVPIPAALADALDGAKVCS